MDYEKTGRLIKRKRLQQKLTQTELAEKVFVTQPAVRAWEKGETFPDKSAMIELHKVLGLNPIELVTGLEMYDKDLKKKINDHMKRMDETVSLGGVFTDEDGNQIYINYADFDVFEVDEKGELTGRLINYGELHNIDPSLIPPNPLKEETIPESEYNPNSVYVNHGDYIFVIPVEVLEAMGKPLYICPIQRIEKGVIGLRICNAEDAEKLMGIGAVFDIPENIYNGKWKGLHVQSIEYGRFLCEKMGIRRAIDLMEVEPVYYPKSRCLILHLDKAKRVNVDIDCQRFLMPQSHYETMRDEDDEWDEDGGEAQA